MDAPRRHPWRVSWLFFALAACGSEAKPCVAGDQVQCRCGDGTWGYRTCRPQPSGGTDYGACDCIVGLQPNRASPLQSPYMSGNGSGNGAQDAGR